MATLQTLTTLAFVFILVSEASTKEISRIGSSSPIQKAISSVQPYEYPLTETDTPSKLYNQMSPKMKRASNNKADTNSEEDMQTNAQTIHIISYYQDYPYPYYPYVYPYIFYQGYCEYYSPVYGCYPIYYVPVAKKK